MVRIIHRRKKKRKMKKRDKKRKREAENLSRDDLDLYVSCRTCVWHSLTQDARSCITLIPIQGLQFERTSLAAAKFVWPLHTMHKNNVLQDRTRQGPVGQGRAAQGRARRGRVGEGRPGRGGVLTSSPAAIESIMRVSGNVVLASILAALAWSTANLSSCRNTKHSQ